jgi:hypothetical protein
VFADSFLHDRQLTVNSPYCISRSLLVEIRIADDALVDAGAGRQRRFSFSIVDVPASYQRNLLRDVI